MISGFHDINEICALLELHTALSGNSRPTFPDNLSVQSSGVKLDCLTACPLKIGTTGYPETSVWNYESTLHKIPEERRSRTSIH